MILESFNVRSRRVGACNSTTFLSRQGQVTLTKLGKLLMIFSDVNNERMMFGEIKINDHSVTSPEQIAEKFNDYFTSIGRCPAENIDNSECNYRESIC